MRLALPEPAPMSEMNTTPLIDVMLVLLIMFIVTIPIQTHAVKLDLPAKPTAAFEPDPVRNIVAITAGGAILWNGEAVDRSSLRYRLERVAAMQPEPELHLRPDALARYAIVDEVLADIKAAQVTRMGIVGNEQYDRF